MAKYGWLDAAYIVDTPADLPTTYLPGQLYVTLTPLRLYGYDPAGMPEQLGMTGEELDVALGGVNAAMLGGVAPEGYQLAGNYATLPGPPISAAFMFTPFSLASSIRLSPDLTTRPSTSACPCHDRHQTQSPVVRF